MGLEDAVGSLFLDDADRIARVSPPEQVLAHDLGERPLNRSSAIRSGSATGPAVGPVEDDLRGKFPGNSRCGVGGSVLHGSIRSGLG
jgi:hypothetical protein